MVLKCKRVLCYIFVLMVAFWGRNAFADDTVTINQLGTQAEMELVTPRNIDFSKCTKEYNFPAEKLFYLALASVNANRFEVLEVQSKMGYILFSGANKEFLLSVAKINTNSSMLKITPADNVYHFPYGVIYNINRYIELNAAEQITPIITGPQG